MQFDIVIGNPPYQDSSHKVTSHNLWSKFIKLSYEWLVKREGYIAMITPDGWVTPSADVGKGDTGVRLYDYMRRHYTTDINLRECNKYFPGIASTFSYYIIKKTTHKPGESYTRIATPQGTFSIDLSDVEYIPAANFSLLSLSILNKVLTHPGSLLGFSNNNTREGIDFEKNICEQTIPNAILIYHSSASGGVYKFAKSIHPHIITKSKVLVASSGAYKPVYDEGALGFSAKMYVYYLQPGENLAAIESYIESRLVNFLLEITKTSGWIPYAFRLLPKIDLTRSWTDQEIYEHFKLTPEEIAYVEATCK